MLHDVLQCNTQQIDYFDVQSHKQIDTLQGCFVRTYFEDITLDNSHVLQQNSVIVANTCSSIANSNYRCSERYLAHLAKTVRVTISVTNEQQDVACTGTL